MDDQEYAETYGPGNHSELYEEVVETMRDAMTALPLTSVAVWVENIGPIRLEHDYFTGEITVGEEW
jgi:hypothetical protein